MVAVDASIALAWVLPDSEQNRKHAANIAEPGVGGTEELVAPRLLALLDRVPRYHQCGLNQ